MKKISIILGLMLGIIMTVEAQFDSYVTTGSEMIFSMATIDNDAVAANNILRWSPVFNLQVFGNFDINKNVGFLLGGSIRNVGFINGQTDANNSDVKQKYRTYNFGIPVGFKVGNLNKFFVYGGYEIEFPFHYKEKTFVNGSKQDAKISTWFSNRVPAFYNSAFVGIQFPYGMSLKFKYYFTNFFNEAYTTTVDGVQTKPYDGYKVNVYYFSISYALFRNTENTYKAYHEIY